jgi:4-amino-4-deoxy-L-arabinose transferase-like glycosyltransferase
MSALAGYDSDKVHEQRRRARPTSLVIALSVLAVAARLLWIHQPYIDHWSWRQSDVAAIARNFSEGGFRFGYPQIDWAGDAAGYVGTEFPILPFLAAICYKFAGIHEWIGRSESVIFFAISLPFFFLLVRELFGSAAAIWATLFFSFAPLNVFAGRSFMPDVPSLSLALIGLYFFLRWIDNGKSTPFFLAAIATSLSILIKLTTIVIAAPLAYIALWALCQHRHTSVPGKRGAKRAPLELWLALFAVITLLPSALWYWHAYQIAENFYPNHFFGGEGVRIEGFRWYCNIAWRTATSGLTPILSIMALIGLFIAPRSKYSALFHWWLTGMILYIVVVGYGNRHPWYQLPLVPIAAAFAGAACAFIGSKISSSRVAVVTFSILLTSSFAVLAYLCARPIYEASALQLRDAGLEIKKITARDALIVAGDTGDPTILYYAERKGWHFPEKNGIYDDNVTNSQQLIVDFEQLRRRGATHLVFTANTFWWLVECYPEFGRHLAENAALMETTPHFRIYKLSLAAK